MRIGLITISRLALIFALTVSVSSFAYTYVVKKGDTLSGIVKEHLEGRIYGKNGNLARVLRRNPSIKNPDRVYPGAEISITDGRALAGEAVTQAAPQPQAETPVQSVASETVPKTASGTDDQSLFIIPQLVYTQIYARDKGNGGTLRASDGNYGLRLGYSQRWSDTLSLFAVVNWYKINLKSPLASGTTTSEKSYSGFNVGSKHKLSDSWVLGTSLGYQEEPIVSAVSLTNLVIDRVGLIEGGLSLSHKLTESENSHFSLWGELGGSLSLPAKAQSYDVGVGSVFYGKLPVRANLAKRTRFELGPYYRLQTLSTNLVSQKLTSFGLGAQFQWLFGE